MKVKEILSTDFEQIEKFMQESFYKELIPIKFINPTTYVVDHRNNRPEKEDFYVHPRIKQIYTLDRWKKATEKLFKNHEDTIKKSKDTLFL